MFEIGQEVHNTNLAEKCAHLEKILKEMVHDIQTPVSIVRMIVSLCSQMPEEARLHVREAMNRISGITKTTLDQYKAGPVNKGDIEKMEALLLSSTLLHAISEKKYQYHNQAIEFISDFSADSSFAFVQLQPVAFKRMISNLINNAIDAFEQKPGTVWLKLEAALDTVKVIIQDNGKGMPQAVIDKIMNNVEVSAGKADGHGIGLGQVRDTLVHNKGKMQISSVIGEGTTITLSFPRTAASDPIVQEINLSLGDTVLILDTDPAVHSTWNKRFSLQAPGISVLHFTSSSEVIRYIEKFTDQQKEKFVLLTDYELSK